MATYGPRGNLGVKDFPGRSTELQNPQRNLGYPFPPQSGDDQQRTIRINENEAPNKTNNSTSPVVLVAGPGPDGKPVTKPPEGNWIISNPRLPGLLWILKIKENKHLVAELKRI